MRLSAGMDGRLSGPDPRVLGSGGGFVTLLDLAKSLSNFQVGT